jgi:hypothetical protein
MRIAIPKGDGQYHLLTNKGLQTGDRVFPMTRGWNDGSLYYVIGLNGLEISGFPNDPHIILDLHYNGSKSYEVQTDRGWGPMESYFKLESGNSADVNHDPHEPSDRLCDRIGELERENARLRDRMRCYAQLLLDEGDTAMHAAIMADLT